MNKVLLIGRLTRDPELRYTGSNRAVTQITIAVNRNFANQNGEREADFINVVVWDKAAENLKKYVGKGRMVAVEGRIQTRNYDNNEGKKVYVTEVVAQNVQFLDSRSASDNSASYTQVAPTNTNNVSPYDFDNNNNMETVNVESDPFASFGSSVDLSDNDLPF